MAKSSTWSYVVLTGLRDVRGCWKSSTSTSDRHLTDCKNLALDLPRPAPGGGGLKCYAHPAGPLVPRFLDSLWPGFCVAFSSGP